MGDKFDAYREALVIETVTEWPEEYDEWELSDRERIAQALHADPQQAGELEYVRVHSGFCRKITVTPDDVARLS